MKIELGRKIDMAGCGCPVSPGEKDGEVRYPRLDIDLTEKSLELLEELGTSGSAKISYKVKRMSVGDEWNDSKGSVCLEITGIEPITSEKEDDEEEEIELSSDEALTKFLKNSKKAK